MTVFTLRKPSECMTQERLAAAQNLQVSYPYQLRTRDGLSGIRVPKGYAADHTRSAIGLGEIAFEKAKEAMRCWKHFDLGWVRVVNPKVEIAVGELVAVEAHAVGLWSINVSRILYVVDEPNRFGYGYGTTAMHIECGEERFLLEFDAATGSVWYDLLAVSRPAHWLAWLGYPYTRSKQKRFARESHQHVREMTSKLHFAPYLS